MSVYGFDMLRLELPHRLNEQRGIDNAKHRTVLFLLLQHLILSYILSGEEVARLEYICLGTVMRLGSRNRFRQWLAVYEGERISRIPTLWILYRYYHASHLQRLFLRRVVLLGSNMRLNSTGGSACVAIAGSFPLSLLMNSFGDHTWHPNDIDIFVGGEMDFEYLVSLYIRMLLLPLGVQYNFSSWKNTYQPRSKSRVRTVGTGRGRVELGSFTHKMCLLNDRRRLAKPTVAVVTRRIENWLSQHCPVYSTLRRQRNSTSSAHIPVELIHETTNQLSRGTQEAMLYEMTDQLPPQLISGSSSHTVDGMLHETTNQLPREFQMPCYCVRRTARFRFMSGSTRPNVPDILVPINIVLISPTPSIDVFPASFPDLVKSSFDIVNCAVSLHVTEDLVYETVCSEDIKALNASHKLKLTPMAFGSSNGSVGATMQRLDKYFCRGYHW